MHKFRRKSGNKSLTSKTLFIHICAWLLAGLGIVFAASMGQLDFYGIALVHEFELGNKLPITPVFQPGQGNVADYSTLNFPTGVVKLSTQTTEWDGEKVTLYLKKPSSAPNPDTKNCWIGNPDITFGFTNNTIYEFTNGQVSVGNFSGAWNATAPASVSASLSSATVNSFSNFAVNVDICSAISISTTDYAKITVSYIVLGSPKTLEIEIYFVPDLFPLLQYNPAGPNWTNQNVTATLSFANPAVRICAANNTAYASCSSPSTYQFTANGNYTFYYYDNVNRGTAVATVSWIDKVAPTHTETHPIREIGYTTLTFGVAGVSDTGGSGLAGCKYSIDNGVTWTNIVSCTSYVISGLELETSYQVQFRVYDNAGNYTQSAGATLVTTNMFGGLPMIINQQGGQYFVLGGKVPTGTVPLSSTWNGQIFTFVMLKPASIPNSNENFTFTTTPITNVGDLPWTNGTLTATYKSDSFMPGVQGSKTTTTISSTTVQPGASMTVSIQLDGKINANVDYAEVTVTYKIQGVSPDPFFKIIFYWIPNNGYALYYDANGGSGLMAGSACASATTACSWDSAKDTGLRVNGFTPPAGKTTFVGWNTKADGTGISLIPGTPIPASTFTAKSSNTIYAIWQ